MSIVQKATEDFKVPEILERRTLPEDFRGSRYMDDEEVMISSLVDQSGHISRIFDFMVVLTRIEKIDHRLFCLELIKNYLTKEQSLQFVENGGFRILRRWMKLAEDNDNVEELRFILTVCENLPFVESAVRHAEIGKSIKRISKHVSSSGRNTSELYAAANRVMDLWKKQILSTPEDAGAKTETQKPLKEQRISISSQEIASSRVESSKSVSEAKSTATSLSSSGSSSSNAANASAPSSSTNKTTTTTATSTQKSTRLIDLIRRSEPVAVSSSTSTSTFTAFSVTAHDANATTSVVASSKSSGEKRERRSLDMEASAKKLLESRQHQQHRANNGQDSGTAMLVDDDDQLGPTAAPLAEVKPLGKGGLKSKTSTGTKKKLNISWADETGKLLREVRYIEVDKIKSSVANYKSHKDLVKREKQMEKETYFTGKLEDEVMTKTTDWRVPKRLVLPMEITDNMGTPNDSKEIEIQQRRQSLAVEVIYRDDSLIPDDPEEDLNVSRAASSHFSGSYSGAMDIDAPAPDSGERPVVRELSWYMDDETPAAAMEQVSVMSTSAFAAPVSASDMMVMSQAAMFNNMNMHQQQQYAGMMPQQQQQSSFNNNLMGGNMNMMNPANSAMMSMMMPMNMPSTMMFPGNNMNNNMNINNTAFGAVNTQVNGSQLFLAASTGDLQIFFNSLPVILQSLLDPAAVKLLMQDPTLVMTLLLDNGSVNTYNVHVLQKATSVSDYRMKVHLPNGSQGQGMMNHTNGSSRWGVGGGGGGGNSSGSMATGGGLSMPMTNIAASQSSSYGSSSSSSSSSLSQHHSTKKSQVPCRYFNTSKGCMHGDKCPFGHFGHGGSGGSNSGGGNKDTSVVASAVAAAAAAASALMANASYTGGSTSTGPGQNMPPRANMPMMGTNVNAGGRMNRRRR